MLPSERESKGGIPRHTQRDEGGTFKRKLPEGMTHKRLESSRQISKHPEIVEKIKAQARAWMRSLIVAQRGKLRICLIIRFFSSPNYTVFH